MSSQFSPTDIVLSCTICQKTLSTIYANDDPIGGLCKDGEGPNDGKITKLWLTECAHLTCGSHLPGGGAPFHSIHEVPQAPCPLCSMEKDDQSDKALFFINGTSKGQYHENIPETYFQTPPIQLSGGDPGLEALRFQYLSLLRSSTKTHEKLMGLAKALGRWEDKKPEIVRSLSSVAPLRDELLSAGRRLMVLGEDVSSIETTLKLVGVRLTGGLHPRQQLDTRSQDNKMDLKTARQKSSPLDGGSRLALGSAADLNSLKQSAGVFKGLDGVSQQDSMGQDGSLSKRKREDSRSDTEHQTQYVLRGGGFEKCRSREQMPPPPIRMQQPFAYRAGSPSSNLHSLHSQHSQVRAAHFLQTAVTPHQQPSEGGISPSVLTPGSSTEPSKISLAEARTNTGHSTVYNYQSARTNTGSAGPVYARGGWQPLAESFDTERSGNYSSSNSSLPPSGQPAVRRSMGYHLGSLMFPIDLGDRIIDPSNRCYQSVDSDGSLSYHRKQSALAMQSQLESPALSYYHSPSPNREGRITLSRIPSFASQHSPNTAIGLSSHIRSSSRHTNSQLTNSNSHRQQLVTATPAHQLAFASPHFPMRQMFYSSSPPSVDRPQNEISRCNNSFDSVPTPVNGEMRPYSSTSRENIVLAQMSHAEQTRGRAALMASQASGLRRRANR